MFRVVLDTDVMVAAFDSPSGASRQLLLYALDGGIQIALSTPLLLEYEAVLTRPAMRARSRLSTDDIIMVLDELAGLCIPVPFDFRWRPAATDPGDDLVLETAINGSVSIIVSFNSRHMAVPAARFGIAVERPGNIMRRIRQ
jgi:putative PIN family toxin of toxin-antitoxin system